MEHLSVDLEQEYWDKRWTRAGTPTAWALKRGATILKFLHALSLDHPMILDLGCGIGWFTEQLSHCGEAIGVDPSEGAIARARSEHPHIRFVTQGLYEIPFPPEYFDVVVAQEVIPHVEDQTGYLRLAADVLKPGGYLVLATANKFVVDRIGDNGWNWKVEPAEHVERHLDLRGLRRLLRPRFNVLRTATILPMGHGGILRLINSDKLNAVLGLLIPWRYLQALKGWAGLGYQLIVLAQKRLEASSRAPARGC